MSTNTLILILGLVFLAVVGVLGSTILRSRRGGTLQAGFEAVGVKLSFKLSQEARNEVDKHLQAAVARTGKAGGEVSARESLAATAAVQQGRILWVDDHPDNNVQENLMLTGLGLSITQATSTGAALDYLHGGSFDLLITDLGRDGDPNAGLELLGQLRSTSDPPPSLVYTIEPGERAKQARHLGAEAVIEAPGELLRTVLAHFVAE